MFVYIMRHGQTIWNAKNITQGRRQNRLSEFGKEQAEKVSKKFKQGDVDVIISSPLMRTMQTANIMNKVLKTKILRDERILEIDKGVLAGRTRTTLTEEEKSLKKENPHALKMESVQDVVDRVRDFSAYLLSNFHDKKVLVVTHDIVAFILEKILLKDEKDVLNYYEIHEGKYTNAEIRKFTID